MNMKDDDTGQEFHFNYNDWLKSSIDNPTGATELAAIRPDIPPLSGKQSFFTISNLAFS